MPLEAYYKEVARIEAKEAREEQQRLEREEQARQAAEKQKQIADEWERERPAREEKERLERERLQAEEQARFEKLCGVFHACRPTFIKEHLNRIGLAPLEQTAQVDLIPEAIKKVMPLEWLSYGLVGGFGAGKTFALAARVVRSAEKGIDAQMEKMIQKGSHWEIERAIDNRSLSLRAWPLWCNWPGDVTKARGMLFEFGREVEEWILSLTDPSRLLIIDDLGADRTTAQDWTGEVLARVIDERLRHQGMTVWTSNLDAKGLVERYGPRTYSRLQALAPMILLPKLPDQRLLPKPAGGNVEPLRHRGTGPPGGDAA